VHRAVERSTEEDERVRVVGFRVEPYSIKHVYDENIDFNVKTTQLNTCSAQRPARNDPTNYQRIDGSTEVVFTYDVEWEDSATPWAHRWDVFLQGNPVRAPRPYVHICIYLYLFIYSTWRGDGVRLTSTPTLRHRRCIRMFTYSVI